MTRARLAMDSTLAACAGAGLAAAAQAWAWPVLPGAAFYDVKLLIALFGTLPLGLLAGAAAAAWALLRLRRADARALPAAAFRGALLFGLGSLIGVWIFHVAAFHPATRLGALVGAALGILLPLPGPPVALARALGGLALATAFALLLGLGRSDRLDLDGFDPVADRTPLPAAAADSALGRGPDVLLVSVDTLRADAVLDPAVPLPNLSALRARGLGAPFGRAPAPSTLPSHVTMVTGAHPLDTGCYTNSSELAPEAPATLAEVFRVAGWRAAGVAANGLLDRHTGFTRGFEAFSNVSRHDPGVQRMTSLVLSTRRMATSSLFLSDAATIGFSVRLAQRRTNVPPRVDDVSLTADAPLVARAAAGYLEELYAQERPFFFFLHFMDPHLPYAPADEAEVAGRLLGDARLPNRYARYGLLSSFFASEVRHDLDSDDPAVRADAAAALAVARLTYLEELMAVDAALGEVFARVERSGRPCLVLFTSDHGEHFGEHGLTGHGNSLYEELLRVPFILAGPGVPAGSFAVTPRLEDVPLTLLHAAGIRPRGGMGRGRDLLDPAVAESAAFAAHEDMLAVLDEQWKARFAWSSAAPRTALLDALSLVSLAADPQEVRDLAAAAPERLAALRERAERERAAAVARLTRSLSAEERADLAQLGYVFDDAGNVVAQ